MNLVIASVFAFCINVNSQDKSKLSLLDANKDGIVNPYEALDVLLTVEKQAGKALKVSDLEKEIIKLKKEDQSQVEDLFKELDKNKDDIIQANEASEDMIDFLQMMDTNGDRSVSKKEAQNFNIEKAIFLSDQDIKNEVNGIFQQLGTNGIINLSNLDASTGEQLSVFDLNSNGTVTKKEALKFMKSNSTEASFVVKEGVAYMNGTICSSTPAKVLELLVTHPEVKTIELQIVPGSIDDVANLRASLYAHKFGLNTKVTSNSMIASGGTDFFLGRS